VEQILGPAGVRGEIAKIEYLARDGEGIANARLIAAAPELLHEARRALAFLVDLEASANSCTDPASSEAAGFHITVNGLRAAIAKAEGK
jgi:hypothetical protein